MKVNTISFEEMRIYIDDKMNEPIRYAMCDNTTITYYPKSGIYIVSKSGTEICRTSLGSDAVRVYNENIS